MSETIPHVQNLIVLGDSWIKIFNTTYDYVYIKYDIYV